MLATRRGRRALGGAVVLTAAFLTGFVARSLPKSGDDSAPVYRQKGRPDAPVVIVEFSDFECPHCHEAERPLKEILSLYGTDVRLVFKNFPIERIHRWAKPAAIAAECAGRQGRFWPYHDLLFERQDDWSRESAPRSSFTRYATELGLDTSAWRRCVEDPAVAAIIAADAQEAKDRWIGATPTFFINGKRFVNGDQLASRGTIWIDKRLKDRSGQR